MFVCHRRIRRKILPRVAPASRATALVLWMSVLGPLLPTSWGSETEAISEDLRFLQGLRDRQLFRLAETFCHQQLDAGQPSPAREARLTVELVRCYAVHARHAPRAERDKLWRLARQTAAEYLRQSPDSPLGLLVRVQDALTLLAQGELWQEEAEARVAGAPSLEQAWAKLREAVQAFRALEEEVTRQIPLRHRRADAGAEPLSVNELHALRGNLQFQAARALRKQASCFPAGSADSLDALNQSVQRLTVLVSSAATDELRWQSLVELVACFRMLKRFDDARRIIDNAEARLPPESIALHLKAEAVRLALAEGRPEDAETMLRGTDAQGKPASAEIDLLRVEAYVTLWMKAHRAGQPQAAKVWEAQATQMLSTIDRRHGAYWQRRAQSVLVTAAEHGMGVGNLDVLTHVAEDCYRLGELDEAVAKYTEAAAKAKDAGMAGQAFELALKAASIDHSRQRHAEALQRFRQAALDLPSHARAAESHLLAVFNASALARQTGDASSLARYEDLLEEQLKIWPNHPATADQARWWLGRLLEHQKRWPRATSVFRGISADFPEFREVIRALARCYEQWLPKLQGDTRRQEAARAVSYFEGQSEHGRGQDREDKAAIMGEAAVLAAELRIRYLGQNARAAQALSAILSNESQDDQPWVPRAKSLVVIALAGQGKWNAATDALHDAGDATPRDLLTILELLALGRQTQGLPSSREFGQLQLEVVHRLETYGSQLSEPERTLISLARADALACTDQRDKAIEVYRQLAHEQVNNGSVQERYASLLLESADRRHWTEALDQWRNVLQRSRDQSDRWYRAKYAVALAHYKLGDKERAAKMIRLTRALYPELGGPAMREQFVDLLERCSTENKDSSP